MGVGGSGGVHKGFLWRIWGSGGILREIMVTEICCFEANLGNSDMVGQRGSLLLLSSPY